MKEIRAEIFEFVEAKKFEDEKYLKMGEKIYSIKIKKYQASTIMLSPTKILLVLTMFNKQIKFPAPTKEAS